MKKHFVLFFLFFFVLIVETIDISFQFVLVSFYVALHYFFFF